MLWLSIKNGSPQIDDTKNGRIAEIGKANIIHGVEKKPLPNLAEVSIDLSI